MAGSSENTTLLDNSKDATSGETDHKTETMIKMAEIFQDKSFLQKSKEMSKVKELVGGPSSADENRNFAAKEISSTAKIRKRKAGNAAFSDNSEAVSAGKTETMKSGSKFQGKKVKNAEKQQIAGPSTADGVIRSPVSDKKIASQNGKKAAVHPPISEMVIESLKALKKRTGATVEQISTHIDENYQTTSKVLKSYIKRFLKKGEERGVLERVIGANAEEKFKIKKVEEAKKGKRDLASKKRKVGIVKKTPVQKKQRKM